MPSDRSRAPDDVRPQYQGVVLQQGRVILDRDFNEQQAIVSDQIADNALAEIGPCGTPDEGFQIRRGKTRDFEIRPGVYYVGGQRVVLSDSGPWTWRCQPDQLDKSKSPLPDGPYLVETVYLHLREQEVSAVEDPALLDEALGGPDTTQRLRLMRNVERLSPSSTNCDTAWNKVTEEWTKKGYSFNGTTMRLEPNVSLAVASEGRGTPVAANPCESVAAGGYLGAENQTIRVQIAESVNGEHRLLWGYDNASSLYRISTDGTSSVVLQQPPVDGFHFPKKDQVVEILQTQAFLPDGKRPKTNAVSEDITPLRAEESIPSLSSIEDSIGTTPVQQDAPDPIAHAAVADGARAAERCVAQATGQLNVVVSFDPTSNKVVLKDNVAQSHPVFMRVWQGLQPFKEDEATPLLDSTGATAPGVDVIIRRTNAAPMLPLGAFWIMSVRPGTPQQIYPQRYLEGAQPPEGPRQWIAPLATIDWSVEAEDGDDGEDSPDGVTDCRPHFDNLVELTRRRVTTGCCSIDLKPSDAPRLQMVLDGIDSTQGTATICFQPGTYNLPRTLEIKDHSQLVLECCRGEAVFKARPERAGRAGDSFRDGLLLIAKSHEVRLRNLAFTFDKDFTSGVQSMIGVHAVNSSGLTVENCSFRFDPDRRTQAVGAGIKLEGDCTRLRVERCRFVVTSAPSVVSRSLSAEPMPEPFMVSPAEPAAEVRELAPATSEAPSEASDGSEALPGRDEEQSRAADIDSETPTVLSGIMALSEFGNEGPQLQTLLHDAEICDNDFRNLTFAVVALADLGSCRLHDNRGRGCRGGFVLVSSDGLDDAFWTGIKTLPVIAPAIASSLKLPWALSSVELQELREKQARLATRVDARIDISNNCLDTLVQDQTPSTSTLVVSVRRAHDRGASATISGNDLRGQPALEVPVVLLMTDEAASNSFSTVTGNVIVNVAFRQIIVTEGESESPRMKSLWIDTQPRDPQILTIHNVAVTGNVLVGATNLGELKRRDLTTSSPVQHWKCFNSITG